MSKRDYYDVLGVSKSASDSELKKAFKKLAMKYHLIEILMMILQPKNLKKLPKHMMFYLIHKKNLHMISLVMQECKAWAEAQISMT